MTTQTLEISGSSHDIAAWLLATVQNALVECDRDPVNRAYVAAGQIAWDDCCGMLVVAPERIYKSARFPEQNANEELCWGGYLAIDFLVLLVRCVPVVDDRGRAPSAAALQSAYKELIEDAAVVYNACISPLPYEEWERALPTQTFVGAEGGCIAVETRLTLGIPQDLWAICCAEPTPHEPGDPICRIPAERVTFEPCEGLTSTNVQDAICELAALVEPVLEPAYAALSSTVDQTLLLNTATPMTLNTVAEANDVSVVSSSQITFARTGIVDVQFSAQLHHRSGGGSGESVWIWLAKNGTAVPDSATQLTVPNGRFTVAAWDWLLSVNAGDHVQIMWLVNNANIALEHANAAPPIPAIPSLIVTVLGVT
jgi:hypothetical protein